MSGSGVRSLYTSTGEATSVSCQVVSCCDVSQELEQVWTGPQWARCCRKGVAGTARLLARNVRIRSEAIDVLPHCRGHETSCSCKSPTRCNPLILTWLGWLRHRQYLPASVSEHTMLSSTVSAGSTGAATHASDLFEMASFTLVVPVYLSHLAQNRPWRQPVAFLCQSEATEGCKIDGVGENCCFLRGEGS